MTTSSFSSTRFRSRRGRFMPVPTSSSRPMRPSCPRPVSTAAAAPEHSKTTSKGSSTSSNASRGTVKASGATARRAPRRSPSSRRVGEGSLTVRSFTPRAASATSVSAPIGPVPLTRTRGGLAPPSSAEMPLSVIAWSATASGSHRAASRTPISSGSRTSCDASTRVYWANAPCHSRPAKVGSSTHRPGRWARQGSHAPQPGSGPPTTRSPTVQSETSEPSAAMRPAYSCPPIDSGRAQPSITMWRSVPQIPQWLTSISASRGPSSGSARSSTAMVRAPRFTAARIVVGSRGRGAVLLAEDSTPRASRRSTQGVNRRRQTALAFGAAGLYPRI